MGYRSGGSASSPRVNREQGSFGTERLARKKWGMAGALRPVRLFWLHTSRFRRDAKGPRESGGFEAN